jgi:hypothetical protein
VNKKGLVWVLPVSKERWIWSNAYPGILFLKSLAIMRLDWILWFIVKGNYMVPTHNLRLMWSLFSCLLWQAWNKCHHVNVVPCSMLISLKFSIPNINPRSMLEIDCCLNGGHSFIFIHYPKILKNSKLSFLGSNFPNYPKIIPCPISLSSSTVGIYSRFSFKYFWNEMWKNIKNTRSDYWNF